MLYDKKLMSTKTIRDPNQTRSEQLVVSIYYSRQDQDWQIIY